MCKLRVPTLPSYSERFLPLHVAVGCFSVRALPRCTLLSFGSGWSPQKAVAKAVGRDAGSEKADKFEMSWGWLEPFGGNLKRTTDDVALCRRPHGVLHSI